MDDVNKLLVLAQLPVAAIFFIFEQLPSSRLALHYRLISDHPIPDCMLPRT